MSVDYANSDRMRAKYRAAYESPAAKKWIQNLPAALRHRAEKIGLLKPYFDPQSVALEYKENDTPSNWKATFDENDFAFAELDAPALAENGEEQNEQDEI